MTTSRHLSSRLDSWIRSAAVAFVGLSLVCPTVAVAQNTSFYLQQNLHRVQKWLGSNQNAENWRRYLDLGVLESQAALGIHAQPEVLAQMLERFHSGAAGLDHPYFSQLRSAIADHLSVVERAATAKIDMESLKPEFQPITDQQLEQARRELLRELRILRQYYREERSEAERVALMQQLQLDELIQQLSSVEFGNPDNVIEGDERFNQRQRKILVFVRSLRALQPQFRIVASQQANYHTQIVERRLANLERLATFGFNPDSMRDFFTRAVDELPKLLEQLDDPANRQAHLRTGQILGQLRELGQRTELDLAVRRRYSKPNFRLTVSEELANQFAQRMPVRDARPVDEVILGNRVQGFAYTNGRIAVDFVENPHEAHVSVQVRGQIDSDGRTEKGPVTAYTNSTAQFEGRRSIVTNVGGITEFAPYVAAHLHSQFSGTNWRLRLINLLAYNQFSSQQALAESIAAKRAERRIHRQFSNQSRDSIDQGKQQFAEARQRFYDFFGRVNDFRYRFARAPLPQFDDDGNLTEPDDVIDAVRLPEARLHTSQEALFATAFLEDDGRLGALSNPPEYNFPAGVRVQLHQSMVANLIAPLLDGRTHKSTDFAKIVESFASEVPPALQLDPKDEFTVTFEAGQPIQVTFDDQTISIFVNGANFEKEGNDTGPMFVKVKFRIVRDGGALKLVRDGSPVIDFSRPGEKTVDQVTTRTLIQEEINKSLPDDPLSEAVELPQNLIPIDLLETVEGIENLEEIKRFRLVQLRAEDGWLTLGWSYMPPERAVGNVISFPMDTPAIHPVSSLTPADPDVPGEESTDEAN